MNQWDWTEEKNNLPHSILVQLRRYAREAGENPQVIQRRYATERLMYRISKSEHADRFVLKGAWLFFLWGDPQRATGDVDFLGELENSREEVSRVFKEIIEVEPEVDDGLDYDPETMNVDPIQEGGDYQGLRVRMKARLGDSKIPTKIDLGFGEKLAEDPVSTELPAILELPRPKMHVYSKEAVIAEKLEAIVKFGTATTRFKDYFDILVLSRDEGFQGRKLQAQVEATFEQRQTELPSSVPEGLKDAFGEEEDSQKQWQAFRRRKNVRGGPNDFADAITRVRKFVYPVLQASAAGRKMTKNWRPEEGWV